ncbi:MAG: methylisocitrate lyase, partial [Nitrosomonadales bacterium]|nr:methylisocitrate lyase [Nitrosomonadales bacterium]MBT6251360.1 methylisocitrate lyase [Nitrosomonadales bacterium]
ALAVEGLQSSIDRTCACVEAGADMIFPEAINDLETYKKFTQAVDVPVLANITEFGATPLFSLDELDSVGIAIALYPLSAFRAMNKAALNVYKGLREEGTQKNLIEHMQTREELYEYLDYHEYEKKLDRLFKKEKD